MDYYGTPMAASALPHQPQKVCRCLRSETSRDVCAPRSLETVRHTGSEHLDPQPGVEFADVAHLYPLPVDGFDVALDRRGETGVVQALSDHFVCFFALSGRSQDLRTVSTAVCGSDPDFDAQVVAAQEHAVAMVHAGRKRLCETGIRTFCVAAGYRVEMSH